MKYIHFPTIAMHALLLMLVQLTIRNYPDGFLVASVVILIGHIIYSAASRRPIVPVHTALCVLQIVLLYPGLIPTGSAPLSMGSDLALFFYQIALAVSCAFEVPIWLLKRKKA